MRFKVLLITSIVLFGFCNSLWAQHKGTYQVVYEADKEGNRISGSLGELLEYVRNGNLVRVGWELGKKGPGQNVIEHWTDAGFITIVKGHVFAQISSIYAQGTSAPSIEIPFVRISDEPDGWVSVIATTGVMHQKFKRTQEMVDAFKRMGLTDKEVDEQFKKQEQSKVPTKWAVLIGR
ncbi:hypothetical protein [Roseivirga misakiensis]|uniref:Uncharacterized protein n=1 Tax=Roseivirga misakiensis TaxID=1563681 RepID=A0A1E5T4N8_9BACT|nr:hypothetical protein [Roseivirga misakiensis]OEK06247.1 hypothetical protein BFP71_00805 [Roseivirga misakiensis]